MSELDKVLNEAIAERDGAIFLDTHVLLSMIGEAIDLKEAAPSVSKCAKNSKDTVAKVYQGLPSIPVSELDWGQADSAATAVNVTKPQLLRFLQPLMDEAGGGNYANLKAIITLLQKYFPRTLRYDHVEQVYHKAALAGRTQIGTIQKMQKQIDVDLETGGALEGKLNVAISFLAFYKALTEILRNFNESAAGFSFESFLATLLGGTQFPTGTGTIADLQDGANTMISLKLLRMGGIIEGSYQDLVNDLMRHYQAGQTDFKMHYLVCLKDIRGEGMDASGFIRFYKFYFDDENLIDIMEQSSATKDFIELPLYIAANKPDNWSPDGNAYPRQIAGFGRTTGGPAVLGYYEQSGANEPWVFNVPGALGAKPTARGRHTAPIEKHVSTQYGAPYIKVVNDNWAAITRQAVDNFTNGTYLADSVATWPYGLNQSTRGYTSGAEFGADIAKVAAILKSMIHSGRVVAAPSAPTVTNLIDGWLGQSTGPVGKSRTATMDFYLKKSRIAKQTPDITRTAGDEFQLWPKTDTSFWNQYGPYWINGLMKYVGTLANTKLLDEIYTLSEFEAFTRSKFPRVNDITAQRAMLAKANELNLPSAVSWPRGGAPVIVGERIGGRLWLVFRKALNTLREVLIKSAYQPVSDFYTVTHQPVAQAGGTVRFRTDKFINAADSKQFLDTLRTADRDSYVRTLRLTRGYLTKKNFALSRQQFQRGMTLAGATLTEVNEKDGSILSEAAGASEYGYIGTLYVGIENVVQFSNVVKDELGETIYKAFRDLSMVKCNIEAFYASGLSDKQAKRAALKYSNALTRDITNIQPRGKPPTT